MHKHEMQGSISLKYSDEIESNSEANCLVVRLQAENHIPSRSSGYSCQSPADTLGHPSQCSHNSWVPKQQQSSGFCPNLPLLSTAVPQDLRGISQSPHSSTSSHQNVKRLGSLMTMV